jgi:hypothetical protein
MMSAADIDAAVASGRVQQLAGFVLLSTGAVLAIVSAVLFGVYDPGPQLSVSATTSGAAATLRFALP